MMPNTAKVGIRRPQSVIKMNGGSTGCPDSVMANGDTINLLIWIPVQTPTPTASPAIPRCSNPSEMII